jgi:predicted unusual protein kinase regulating ubiquinone biosynthesis (AarF/ABC1/UbiB family)
LGARTSASLLFSKSGESAAERAAEVLGTLRGIAAKVGQMASYVDGIVPEGQREAYEIALRRLRDQAPTSTSSEIRALVELELGARISELFADWEDEPIASASIGQVHRARLFDGRVVAVKVQHSGIAKAVESDLENVGMLESVVGTVVGKGVNSRGVLNEVKARFREELDYRLEARRQGEFAQLFRGDPQIFVPPVIAERSSARVLTSEFVTGSSLDEAATLSEAERRAYAEALWRFVFKGNLVGGMFNADPHPGNYVFQAQGRVAFLEVDQILEELRGKVDHVLVDMHAEATSEKVAMGWYLDGRATAVVGTHTHVPTADARVLPGGTAYITDVGMTGPRGGVIGVRKEQAIDSLRTHMSTRFETSEDDPWLNAVVITAAQEPFRAAAIEQVLVPAAPA